MTVLPASILAALSSSASRNLLAAIILGAVSGVVEYVVHSTVLEVHLPPGIPTLVDSGMVTIVTATFFYVVLREWRLRRAMVLEQLRIVAELNHHVRNALQRLAYTPYLPPQEQTVAVLESVKRIDKTLKDLFPVVGERRGTLPEARLSGRFGQERRGVH